MNEKELSEETPKEPKIQKFYKVCALIHNIFLIITITWGLSTIGGILTTELNSCNIHSNAVGGILSYFILISLLTSVLFIIIGIALYVLYLFNKIDKTTKTYGKKFIMRGTLGMALTFIIYFVITVIVRVFEIDPMYCAPLPQL